MRIDPVKAYIGLGSNLGDRKSILEAAVADLDRLPQTRVTACSNLLENPARGIPGGNDFLNAAVEIETRLSARELLEWLQDIERRHGRHRETEKREGSYANRTLDLDLLLFGNERIHEPGLVVPHPRMMEREFVLFPLRDLGKVPPF